MLLLPVKRDKKSFQLVEYNVFIVCYLSLLIYVTCMVVRTPNLIYIYIYLNCK